MGETIDDPGERERLAASGLFDAPWYLAINRDVRDAGLDPLTHFCRYGWREGRWPNRYFDPGWYLERYPDVRAVEVNPLLHYLRDGERETRQPCPYFNPAWYRDAYDVADGASALAHFLARRDSGRFAPTPALWALAHLASCGGDPFTRYLDDMERNQREPFPDPDIVAASGLVDPNFYLLTGADVHEARLDPAEHFCRYGWIEDRKPNPYFDTRWYRQTNPEVARLKLDPLVHYIVVGEAAGRRPVPYFDPFWYRETYAIPAGQGALAHFLAHRHSRTVSPTPLFDVAWYVEHHSDEVAGKRDPFAHFLRAGACRDIDPSPAFDSSAYRKRHLGRPSRRFAHLVQPDRDNPLVHHLRSAYR